MENVKTMSRKGEKGFTLVELAIVMIIIGLLIVGILKGQEMIANAQVSSTVTQVKAIEAATSTFRDMFNAIPGDMRNANNRLVDCAADPCNSGDGSGKINQAVGAVPSLSQENVYFFNHLRAADLLSGFDGTATLAFGNALPTAPVGGGFTIGYFSSAVAPTGFTGTEMRPGHYLVVTGSPVAVATATGVLTPEQGARIDRKLDDGAPDKGSVVAQSGNSDCRDAVGTYDENATQKLCAVAIRIQN